jgi:hypothetical protein
MKYVTINQWDIIDTREYITIDLKKTMNPLSTSALKHPKETTG